MPPAIMNARNSGVDSDWAGLKLESSAITSPQNPASPGRPSEAIATNANTPPRYGSFCITPPPISAISRVW